MGSTDSGGHGGAGSAAAGTSCGLVSSLIPNSCRGRAESFARRLHRRLTSLGGEGHTTDDDDRPIFNKATEITWLHAPTSQRTPSTTLTAPTNSANSLTSASQSDERIHDNDSHQSSESDVYYDFDPEIDDSEKPQNSSPPEMANDDELSKIHVNSRLYGQKNHNDVCHCSPGPRPPEFRSIDDRTSGYVFSSPIVGLSPDTDTSDTFYDPESSETDKSMRESFHDIPENSENSETSNFRKNSSMNVCKLSGRRRTNGERLTDHENCGGSALDDSDSSETLENVETTLENRIPDPETMVCSSEESTNGRNSLETTSPSHESLWSTFDDSTVSLQDIDDVKTTINDESNESTNLAFVKSHSDSEITGMIGDEGHDEVDRSIDVVASTTTKIFTTKMTMNLPILGNFEIVVNDADVEGHDDFPKEATSDLDNVDEVENPKTIVKIVGEDSTMEKPSETDFSESADPEEPPANDDKDDDEKRSAGDADEEEEEEYDKPQRVRRCSSLKTGKTPPGTPGRKKIVRFADVLGLDLADVRTFLDEIPKVPNSAYSDLIYDDGFQKDTSPVNFWGTGPATFTTPLYAQRLSINATNRSDKILIPLFQQPGGLANFLDRVRERNVCLENIVVQDPVTVCLQGTVRVRNLDFHKSVHVRYSLDCWKNFSDLQANYASNSCDGFSDKFTFALYCHTLKIGQRLELAVRFQCKGTQYWDNNGGANYCFQCLPATPANPGIYAPVNAPSNGNPGTHEWSPAFY